MQQLWQALKFLSSWLLIALALLAVGLGAFVMVQAYLLDKLSDWLHSQMPDDKE